MLRPDIPPKKRDSRTKPRAPSRLPGSKSSSSNQDSAKVRPPARANAIAAGIKRLIASPQRIWLIIMGSLVAEAAITLFSLARCLNSACKNDISIILSRFEVISLPNKVFLWILLLLLVNTAALASGSARWKALAFRRFIDLQRKLLEYPKMAVILPALVITIAALEILSQSSRAGLGMVIFALILSGLTFYKIFGQYKDLLNKRLHVISDMKQLVGSFLRFRWRLHFTGMICARLVSLVGWVIIGASLITRPSLEIASGAPAGPEGIQAPQLLLWLFVIWGISGVLIGMLRPPRRISDFLGETFCTRCNRFLFLPVSDSEKYCPSCKIGEFPGVFGVKGPQRYGRVVNQKANQIKSLDEMRFHGQKGSRGFRVKFINVRESFSLKKRGN